MKIYLAAGFTVMNVINRERELAELISPYRRLYSFFVINQKTIQKNWLDLIRLKEIGNENISG
jgi:hypothetical protein